MNKNVLSIARASILFTYFGLNNEHVAFLFWDKMQNSEFLLWWSETVKIQHKSAEDWFFFPTERTLHPSTSLKAANPADSPTARVTPAPHLLEGALRKLSDIGSGCWGISNQRAQGREITHTFRTFAPCRGPRHFRAPLSTHCFPGSWRSQGESQGATWNPLPQGATCSISPAYMHQILWAEPNTLVQGKLCAQEQGLMQAGCGVR